MGSPVQSSPWWPILPPLLSVPSHSSSSQPCQSPGTRGMASRIAHRENARAQQRSPPSSAAPTSACTSTTATPRTMLKARSVTLQPPMLPKEIRADLLLEERRGMRENEDFVENEIVSTINLSTVVPFIIAHPNPHTCL